MLPQVHKVSVGNNGFKFDPNTTLANPGDIVSFQFYPTNHSVNRAAYTGQYDCGLGGCNPCVPLELLHPSEAGFHSGNIQTQDTKELVTFNITINDTAPIFVYCDAPSSCHPNKMVAVINPNATFLLETQASAAAAAPYQLSAGQSFPTEEEASASLSSSPVPTATNSAKETSHWPAWPPLPSGSTWSPASGHTDTGSKTDKGKVAGISVGVSAAIVFLLLGLGLSHRRKRRKGAAMQEAPHMQVESIAVPDNSPTNFSYTSASPDATFEKFTGPPIEPAEVPAGPPAELRGENAFELPANDPGDIPPKNGFWEEKTTAQGPL